MSNANVDRMIDDLVGREGKYVNHPSDRGGPTNWGITEQVARAYGYTGDMRSLPRQKAVEIYRTQYWIDPGFARISANGLAKLAEELFDAGVNMGPKRVVKFLQRALNGLNRRANAYPDITPDGDFGRMSMAALNGLIADRGPTKAELVLLRLCDAQQAVRYLEITEGDVKQEDFLFGWIMNRVGEI